MALGIGTDRFITLGRQATGDGVITTDIGTTVTTVFITDGTNDLISRVLPFGRLWYDAACCDPTGFIFERGHPLGVVWHRKKNLG
jgi:hypothetical protein